MTLPVFSIFILVWQNKQNTVMLIHTARSGVSSLRCAVLCFAVQRVVPYFTVEFCLSDPAADKVI